ncbi:MAG: protoporphyrinogen oxidase [Acidimicrobiales bacterium]
MSERRVVVIGAGITGLTAAFSVLADAHEPTEVTVLEASPVVGGLIRTSPFAGLPAVDEGADAFLTRVPWAVQLAGDLGLGGALTSPTGAGAYVWHDRLHEIPGDILMGVPAKVRAFAMSGLFSPVGKLRAGIEPLLPRMPHGDSIGTLIRRRFGRQVHERLVDPLVGSIYAADTDRFSLEAVPQINALTSHRSLLAAAADARRVPAQSGPVFAVPLKGMGSLVATLAEKVTSLGGRIVTSARVNEVSRSADGYTVLTDSDTLRCDAVVLASPAAHTAPIVKPLDDEVSGALAQWHHASVAMVTLAVPGNQWRREWTGSGYLVPKPDQRWVTAASFGSNKWAHWRPDDGSQVLRVSLGRDGSDVMHHDDTALLELTLADLKHHLGTDFQPQETRITRWTHSFPQYRPHHFARLSRMEAGLAQSAPGVFLAGASYRGIGIPACVQQGRSAAAAVLAHLDGR